MEIMETKVIKNGRKLVCGVGRTDVPTKDANGNTSREYNLWKSMLKRSYSKQHEFKAYRNVTVCDRWLTFSNFLEDLPLIENYDKWLQGGYELDKDMKQQGVENKVYSLETCIFLSHDENMKYRDTSSYTKPLISIDVNDFNNMAIHDNISKEVNRSSASSICQCAKGRTYSAYGQRWIYADGVEELFSEINRKFQLIIDNKVDLTFDEMKQLYQLTVTYNYNKLNQLLDKLIQM